MIRKLVQESGIRPRAKDRLKEQLELVGQNLCTMSPDDLALHLKSSEALEKSSEAVEKVCRTFEIHTQHGRFKRSTLWLCEA